MKNALYIVRGEDGSLYLYSSPLNEKIFFEADRVCDFRIRINPELFPEITVENSPQRFEFKIVPITTKNN